MIKDRDGNAITNRENVLRRWKEYFEELRNEKNKRECGMRSQKRSERG